jgi:hypothetical protein
MNMEIKNIIAACLVLMPIESLAQTNAEVLKIHGNELLRFNELCLGYSSLAGKSLDEIYFSQIVMINKDYSATLKGYSHTQVLKFTKKEIPEMVQNLNYGVDFTQVSEFSITIETGPKNKTINCEDVKALNKSIGLSAWF